MDTAIKFLSVIFIKHSLFESFKNKVETPQLVDTLLSTQILPFFGVLFRRPNGVNMVISDDEMNEVKASRPPAVYNLRAVGARGAHPPPPFSQLGHCVKIGLYADISKEPRCNSEIKVRAHFLKFWYFFNVLAMSKPICFTKMIPSMCEP